MKAQKSKPISIALTDKHKSKLDALAAAKGTNRSDMVRHMIDVRRMPKKSKPASSLQGIFKSKS